MCNPPVLPNIPLVADGAMGTRLRSYLPPAEFATPLELLNLTRPELVQHVHREYLEAGADILTTNTFGASALRLRTLGKEDLLDEVNRQAVGLARVVAQSVPRKVYVAGSVGPLGSLRYGADIIRMEEIEAEFERQVCSLVEAGVDFIFVETMDEFREAVAASHASVRYGLPVVCHLVSENGYTLGAHVDLYSAVRKLESIGVASVGLNCRIGPEAMLKAARRLARYAACPLSLQPNATNVHVDAYGRMEIEGGAQAFVSFAQACSDLPLAILGGCCHTTPAHITALRMGLVDSGAIAGDNGERPSRVEVLGVTGEPLAVPRTKDRPPSVLAERLRSGKFFTCVEIDPPTDAEVQADPGILSYKLDGARYLEERCAIDAVTVADHTMGRPWLDGLPFSEALRPHLRSAEILLHYSCRNKAETDIAGNFAAFKLYGYRNILVITGDHPPSSECFYQYSSPKLIERIRSEHGDFFLIACSFDHTRGRSRENDSGLDGEIKRLQRKISAGAQVALTQPIYSRDRVMRLREKTLDLGIPMIPGIMPILSVRHAETVNGFPGIQVPESVINRLAAAGEDRDARARISVEISSEIARNVREAGFPGIYVITPMNRFDVVQQVLNAV